MASPGDLVYPTVEQLRALGTWTEIAGRVQDLDYRDDSDQYDLLSGGVLEFAITKPSAIENHLDPDDRLIYQRVPPINEASCDLSASRDFPGLSIVRRNNVGIYGPHDALSHASWVGFGSVTSPDTQGRFVVSGDGGLRLTIPCWYEVRLNAVHQGTAPEGPPGVYWYRRADHYWPGWGGKEGVYCWLGWEQLDVPLVSPYESSLTMSLTYRTYSFVDNHLTDASRSEEFSWSCREHQASFRALVGSGQVRASFCLAAPLTGGYPLLERVVTLELAGFATGLWQIGEPLLVQADPSRAVLKTFDGVDSPEEYWY